MYEPQRSMGAGASPRSSREIVPFSVVRPTGRGRAGGRLKPHFIIYFYIV